MFSVTKKIAPLLMIGMLLSAPTLQGSFQFPKFDKNMLIGVGIFGLGIATTLGAHYLWKRRAPEQRNDYVDIKGKGGMFLNPTTGQYIQKPHIKQATLGKTPSGIAAWIINPTPNHNSAIYRSKTNGRQIHFFEGDDIKREDI